MVERVKHEWREVTEIAKQTFNVLQIIGAIVGWFVILWISVNGGINLQIVLK